MLWKLGPRFPLALTPSEGQTFQCSSRKPLLGGAEGPPEEAGLCQSAPRARGPSGVRRPAGEVGSGGNSWP